MKKNWKFFDPFWWCNLEKIDFFFWHVVFNLTMECTPRGWNGFLIDWDGWKIIFFSTYRQVDEQGTSIKNVQLLYLYTNNWTKIIHFKNEMNYLIIHKLIFGSCKLIQLLGKDRAYGHVLKFQEPSLYVLSFASIP